MNKLILLLIFTPLYISACFNGRTNPYMRMMNYDGICRADFNDNYHFYERYYLARDPQPSHKSVAVKPKEKAKDA